MFATTRLKRLNTQPLNANGRYVLYWMQQAQRAEENQALECAILQANTLKLPLLVGFGLMADYPEANLRHYQFMLEGLQETQSALAARGINMIARSGFPPKVALELAQEAALLVCDRGYLRHQRAWRQTVAQEAACPIVQVESDVVVPVEVASQKAEYAARTLRPKILKHRDSYLGDIPVISPACPSLHLDVAGLDLRDLSSVLAELRLDRRVAPVSRFFRGGTSQAKTRFRRFLEQRLARYDVNSNQPQTADISGMSPYLHFGQISPVYLAQQVLASPHAVEAAGEAFLEQLIVRRELAINFVEYTPGYDSFACLPGWAQTTLNAHRHDRREALYDIEQLEGAATHDPYWNAAMQELRVSGFMHNYMRMYWGKKILEWSATPETGFATTLALNNRYFLDGRDPNSYAGVGWIYGLHDRAWGERAVFGKVRCMTAAGLRRKCDIQGYIERVQASCKAERNNVT